MCSHSTTEKRELAFPGKVPGKAQEINPVRDTGVGATYWIHNQYVGDNTTGCPSEWARGYILEYCTGKWGAPAGEKPWRLSKFEYRARRPNPLDSDRRLVASSSVELLEVLRFPPFFVWGSDARSAYYFQDERHGTTVEVYSSTVEAVMKIAEASYLGGFINVAAAEAFLKWYQGGYWYELQFSSFRRFPAKEENFSPNLWEEKKGLDARLILTRWALEMGLVSQERGQAIIDLFEDGRPLRFKEEYLSDSVHTVGKYNGKVVLRLPFRAPKGMWAQKIPHTLTDGRKCLPSVEELAEAVATKPYWKGDRNGLTRLVYKGEVILVLPYALTKGIWGFSLMR
jgi:hypothetical protein